MGKPDFHRFAASLGELWEDPDLASEVEIEFSDRLTRSLGRCLPERGLIRLHAGLADAPEALQREVLCHELAHLEVYRRSETDAKPHGPEWRSLVLKAGFDPRRRVPEVFPSPTAQGRRVDRLFEHRCPVCQSVRIARTGARRWRCAECDADGVNAELVVTAVGPSHREGRRGG